MSANSSGLLIQEPGVTRAYEVNLPDITRREGGRAAFSVVFANVCGDTRRDKKSICGNKTKRTHQIPTTILYRQQLILCNDSPNKVFREGILEQLKVELDVVSRAVVKVDEGSASLECPLQKIMTWLKGEDGVQGSDVAAASREIERVRVSILHETGFCLGFGELLLVEWEVSSKPLGWTYKLMSKWRWSASGASRGGVPGFCLGAVRRGAPVPKCEVKEDS